MSSNNTFERILAAMSGTAYGLLAALAVSICWGIAWRVIASPRRPVVAEPITATELACLRSEVAPVVTALAGLRASGRIRTDGRVDRTVAPGPESDWFTERLLWFAEQDRAHTVPGLVSASRGDVTELEHRLSDRGLMRTRAERARIRWGAAPLLLVMFAFVATLGQLVFGFFQVDRAELVRSADEWAFVIPTLIVGGLIILPALLRVNRTTRAGRELLAAQQRRRDYLKPSKCPTFATYGPGGVAISAALFGTAALWSVDGDYASSVGLSGDAGGGADGSGCGSSCGGSSCGGGGSGCGGGGGGGGCGGGGGGCGS